MLSREREIELMRAAVDEAKQSEAEDKRIHPSVGTVLADASGRELCRAHRGENGTAGHAEFHLFRKAREQGINTEGALLFVTLEPCTRRGEGKVPCAFRVAESRIKRVYIGTLDPNPHITGRGEMYLSLSGACEVERFPGWLAKELFALNRDFFAQHQHTHNPVVSPYAGSTSPDSHLTSFQPALVAQREGLLLQSMDLMTGTPGPILLFSGDMSWLRELQISILLARLHKRSVRILCDPHRIVEPEFSKLEQVARSLGADVALAPCSFGVRGTLVSVEGGVSAAICVEKKPTLHGFLFQVPHESGILKALACLFETLWQSATTRMSGHIPRIKPITTDVMAKALTQGVRAYASAKITLSTINTDQLHRLPLALERFKLFRLNQLVALQHDYDVPSAAVICGSPWPIKPPVVEVQGDGSMVVVDGAHRSYSAYERGQKFLEVLLVENVSEPLPAIPSFGWENVKIVTSKTPREERYSGFKPQYFRSIRDAFSAIARE